VEDNNPLSQNGLLVCQIPAAPWLDPNAMRDLKLRTGETIKYDLPCSGEPLPEAKWFVNDKELKQVQRVRVSTGKDGASSGTRTVLKIENAIRSDSGIYEIVLKNASGEARCSAQVTVVSRPSPPKGPLEVKDVCKGGATLNWDVPEDDGGEPLEEYVIEAQESGGKFVEVGRVPAGQTQMKVTGLKNKTDYKFRVKAKNKEGESEPLATENYTCIKDPFG
jgi:hypothetical protein